MVQSQPRQTVPETYLSKINHKKGQWRGSRGRVQTSVLKKKKVFQELGQDVLCWGGADIWDNPYPDLSSGVMA
jgi:hypothetical protein